MDHFKPHRYLLYSYPKNTYLLLFIVQLLLIHKSVCAGGFIILVEETSTSERVNNILRNSEPTSPQQYACIAQGAVKLH